MAPVPANGPLPHSLRIKPPPVDRPAEPMAPSSASAGQPRYPQPPRPAHMCRMAYQPGEHVQRKHHRRRRCIADLLSSQRPLPRTQPQWATTQQHPRRRLVPRQAFTPTESGPRPIAEAHTDPSRPTTVRLTGQATVAVAKPPGMRRIASSNLQCIRTNQLEGWHRLSDQAVDPQYGEPLSRHWDFTDNPADRSRIKPGCGPAHGGPQRPIRPRSSGTLL